MSCWEELGTDNSHSNSLVRKSFISILGHNENGPIFLNSQFQLFFKDTNYYPHAIHESIALGVMIILISTSIHFNFGYEQNTLLMKVPHV